MKKFYVIMGAAVTAATAFAVANRPVEVIENNTLQKVSFENVEAVNEANAVSAQASLSTRAGGTVGEVKLNPPTQQLFFFGLSQKGSYYAVSLGFAPSWGKLPFSAVAEGATAYNWTWSNGWKETYERYRGFDKKGQNIEADLLPGYDGMILDMTLTAENGDASQIAVPFTQRYFAGGSPGYYSENYAEIGLGMYPRLDYKKDDKYMGTTVGYMSIDKTPASSADYDSNGVLKGWATQLGRLNKENDGANISDMSIDGFGYEVPAMSSPYILNGMHAWINGSTSAATSIKGWVYNVGADGSLKEKIAKVSCNLAAGEIKENPIFTITPVDEDGDEIEDMLIIDNQPILITIEGLASNKNITEFTPVFGNGTIVPVAESNDNVYYRNSYVIMNYKYKGNAQQYFGTCPVNYYNDDARTQLFMVDNFFFNLDIDFPFVENYTEMSRDFVATIPVAGGEKEFIANAYYYKLKDLVAHDMMTATVDGDWFTYTLSDPDAQTAMTTITVKANALPAGTTGRSGSVSFKGYGQDFKVYVNQGDVAGVGAIAVDNNAETVYFDLQGRKLNGAPEKGIYLVKEGSKVTKVIR